MDLGIRPWPGSNGHLMVNMTREKDAEGDWVVAVVASSEWPEVKVGTRVHRWPASDWGLT